MVGGSVGTGPWAATGPANAADASSVPRVAATAAVNVGRDRGWNIGRIVARTGIHVATGDGRA